MHLKMPSLEKSPWVLREAPKQLVGNLFQFSVQRLLKMSPVVIMHLRVETLLEELCNWLGAARGPRPRLGVMPPQIPIGFEGLDFSR